MAEMPDRPDPTRTLKFFNQVAHHLLDEISTSTDNEEYHANQLTNFMREIASSMSFRWCPTSPRSSEDKLWVFWCETTFSPCSGGITDSETHTPTTHQGITDKIKYALQHFSKSNCDLNYLDHVLIQFWAPITTETSRFLVTTGQPFGLISKDLDERLLKYRKHCLGYKFNVDGEEHELGIPGRVFRQKWQECTPDVNYYSSKEYPQLNFARTCNISEIYAFPVFQTSFQDCVGVLEFITTTDMEALDNMCNWFLENMLKDVDLKGFFCPNLNFWHHFLTDKGLDDEVSEGLKVVCNTHKLLLAQIWDPCACCNSSYDVRHVLHHRSSASYVQDDYDLLAKFSRFCKQNDLRNGQGVVGRAYLSHSFCFCRDITQFSLIEYPLLSGARYFGLTSCFAICLKNTSTQHVDYILELFLHLDNTYGEDLSTFLCLILETVKQHFPSYKLTSGEELVKELSIELIKPCMNQEPASFECQNTRSPPGPRVLHNGQETMQPHSSIHQLIVEVEVDDTNNGWDVDAEQNSVLISCSHEASTNQEPNSFQCQSTRSPPGPGVLHDARETMQPHSSDQQLIVEVNDIDNGRNVVNGEGNNTSVYCSYEPNSITYEELKKHFGKKLEDVAHIFGVSRSTFKRKCRENKIRRWPQGKRNKVSCSPSRQEAPCSDLPANKLVATVSHTTPLVMAPPEARTTTIKATYGAYMIKFKLTFTSRMVELEEEVFKRLKLDIGTYNISYNDGDDQILIACDEDLQECMSACNSLGMNTIKMFIEPIIKISPST